MRKKIQIVRRTTAQVSGLKKSWQRAKELHKLSDNDGSRPALARSFLSTCPPDADIDAKMLRKYNKYLRNHYGENTSTLLDEQPDTSVVYSSDVNILFDIKELLNKYDITPEQMQKHISLFEAFRA